MTGASASLDRIPEIGDAASLATLIADPTHPALVLFDGGASGPGRRLEERLRRLSAGGDAINLARVDVDRVPDLAQKFGVAGVPALVLFRSGQAAARRLGEIEDDDLQEWLETELAA